MIHRIYSSLPTFKEIEFRSGLNVLLAQKESKASTRQTRNRAGKTSLIEIVNFLMGAELKKDSLFRTDTLVNESFGMTFDFGGELFCVERSGQPRTKILLRDENIHGTEIHLSCSEWITLLGTKMFGLETAFDYDGRSPTFRSLFAYFARREVSEAFTTPEKQAVMQQPVDYQVALLFLLGLDWTIASDWQKVREREKSLAELKKAVGVGAFGHIVGKASELRTELTVEEAKLERIKSQIAVFHVLPQYAELELEATQLTQSINELSNATVIDVATIKDLEQALQAEAPPSFENLESLYAEAGIVLPEGILKRYEDVRSFHESVIQNRRDYLTEELNTLRQNVITRDQKKIHFAARRATVMEVLQSHGALEHFFQLQAEVGRLEATVESLRQRLEAAEQLEGTKTELEIERKRLALRLKRDFSEQRGRLSEATLAFEETSKQLYESAGSMTIEDTDNGPKFQFPMQGSRSKGIKNMQIFCFDIMLMRLCARRGRGPGFLIHDSHLFDGVDGRQLLSALKVGAETASQLGFQYIVTMNEDDAFKENLPDFDLREYVLPTILTDAKDDGGLFGVRF